MQQKYWKYDKIYIGLETYYVESIKNVTRKKRLHGDHAVEYKICDNTDIRNVSLNKFLAHTKTKDALTDYLAHQLLEFANKTSTKLVVAWRDKAEAPHCEVDCL